MIAEHRLDRRNFRQVTGRRRGAVGVDVLHLVRVDPGITQGIGDTACSTRTVSRRRGHVEGVAAHAKTDQLGVDGRATRLGMLKLFKHQRAGTVGQHKAVTALVPRTAGPGRVVVAGRQRTRSTKAAHAQTASSHFCATCNHHICFAVGNVARRHANTVRTGGTGCGDGVVRPLCTQVDRQKAGNHVDDRARHKERRNPSRALLVQGTAGFFDIGQTANTRTHCHTDALTIGVGNFQAGIAHSLKPGCQTVLNKQVKFSGFFDGEVILNVKALYRAAKTGGIGRKIRVFDQTNATTACQNALPGAWYIRSQWRQHPHTGDYDASTRHSTLLYSIDDTLHHT